MPVLILLLLVAFLGLGTVGLAGRRVGARRRASHPPRGRLVDVGGFRMHIVSLGEGEPAVVVDAGQGDFSLSWGGIASRVAEFTRVVTYDRAGLGWSDPSPRPRTAEVMVEELRALLTRAGVPAPYVLVGHSAGGMNVRLFAHKYPDEVAGLVLVDASHEDQFSAPVVRQTFERMAKMMPVMNGAMMWMVRSGLPALRPGLIPDGSGLRSRLPRHDAAALDALLTGDPGHLRAATAELQALDATHAQMRAAGITTLGDIPLVVIRHGAEQPMMASPEVVAALDETFERLQGEMAALSSNGRLVVAEQSGHLVHLDEPDLVVDAIREVVVAARAHRS